MSAPGRFRRQTLYRSSSRRVLTAGAIALAVITPALDPVEHAAEAVPATSPTEAREVSARIDSSIAFHERAVFAERISRSAIRRSAGVRPATGRAFRRPAYLGVRTVQAADRVTLGEQRIVTDPAVRRTAESRLRARVHRAAASRRPFAVHPRTVTTKHAAATRPQRVVHVGNGMTAVIAYARSQVGKRYVRGGTGQNGFDCSGLTKQAYAQAGIQLPHSSRSQAARARSLSRSQARAGDLVIGSGHVGIYMGNGMMIDAGNQRTGVVYRRLYSGLRVGRVR